MRIYHLTPLLLLVAFFGCKSPETTQKKNLDDISEKYVKLALEVGEYDSDFIDAYYGPDEWRPSQKDTVSLPYEELKWRTTALINQINSIDDMGFNQLELLRYQFLNKQLQAVRTKLDMLSGKTYPFDVESLRLYDVVAPHTKMAVYDSLLAKLNLLIPGNGELSERYKVYSESFIIPAEKLDTVFKAAISEARNRVVKHVQLPENEQFELQYVTDKPWSGYNWYKGNARSIIQINTDFPIYIERAIDLACHEGYPGHHVFNAMLEKRLVNELQWPEFQVYPLFSPQSFIAEGSANYGIEVAFSPQERIEFEKEVLFPLAGMNPSGVDLYYEIQAIRKELLGAEIQIARNYLNDRADIESATNDLAKYLQFEKDRALQRLSFYDRYRSYVINYSYGSKLVGEHVREALEADEEKTKWDVFKEILTTPRTASTL